MRRKLYEVKTLEEAKKLAVADFGVKETDLTFTIVSEKKGFLGIGSKLAVEAVSTRMASPKARSTSRNSSKTTAFKASSKRKFVGIMLNSMWKREISTAT